MTFSRRSWFTLSGILLLALIPAFILLRKGASPMPNRIPLKPIAAGRFLIDIPARAEPHYGQGFRGAGTPIEIFPATLRETKELIKKGKDELTVPQISDGAIALDRIVESKNIKNAWTVFYKSSPSFKHNTVLQVTSYFWKKETSIDKLNSSMGLLCIVKTGARSSEDGIKSVLYDMDAFYERLQYRETWAIPSERGFCMAHSFIPTEIPEKDHGERVSISFSVPDHPDIFLRFDTQMVTETVANDEKLLDRIRRNRKNPLFSLGLKRKALRSRERAIGPYDGQEHLEMIEKEGLKTMQFMWEYSGKGDSWDHPAMSLELASSRAEGSTAPLSMTEDEALALWDTVVESIRLRPTKNAEKAAP